MRSLSMVATPALVAVGLALLPRPASAASLVWKSVSAGSGHTCAVRSDATLWCWGSNTYGALGTGDTTTRLRPTRVTSPADAGWASVSTGMGHTCALTTASRLYCWGANDHGQLGLGDTVARSLPTELTARTWWSGVTTGDAHTCSTGMCWGWNGYGQLGTGDHVQRSWPTAVPLPAGLAWAWGTAGLATGNLDTCGITTTHRLFCWGVNWNTQLGFTTPNGSDMLTPGEVGGTDWWKVSPGLNVTCGLTTSYRLRCWGAGPGLGLGPSVRQTSAPVQVGDDVYRQVDAGAFHVCATRYVGSTPHTWCWGYNDRGQLGTGDTTKRDVPTDVGISSGVMTSAGDAHSCDITVAIYCWGDNYRGQIGDGTTTQRLGPVKVARADSLF